MFFQEIVDSEYIRLRCLILHKMFSLLSSREVVQTCKNSIPVIREISCVLLSLFMSIYISRKARRMESVDMKFT